MLTNCIEAKGYRTPAGYGRAWCVDRKKQMPAHRLAWEQKHGTIPDGLLVLHSCDNPPCINVEHLSLGTQVENMRQQRERGRHRNTQKTHCPHGHAYDEANTTISRGRRHCRACMRATYRARHARSTEKVLTVNA